MWAAVYVFPLPGGPWMRRCSRSREWAAEVRHTDFCDALAEPVSISQSGAGARFLDESALARSHSHRSTVPIRGPKEPPLTIG